MRQQTLFYAEGYSHPFSNESDCKKYEDDMKESIARWKDNSSKSKFEKLKHDLEQSTYIHPSTIATCSFDAIAIKSMVKVCQKFAEENKEYLNYY